MKKKIGMLYSGGLDSYVMHRKAVVENPDAEIVSIYYSHGQPAAEKEIAGLPDFVEVRQIDWLGGDKKPVPKPGREEEGAIMIPGRNLMFTTAIACQELPHEIHLGAYKGETNALSTDKNYTFVEKAENVLRYVLEPYLPEDGKDIKVRFPLAEAGWSKSDIVTWALDNGITKEDLKKTKSCFDAGDDACGACIQCFKRWTAFGINGFTEETVIHPLKSEFGKQFAYELVASELGIEDTQPTDTRVGLVPFIIEFYKTNPEMYEKRTAELLDRLI